MPLQVLPKFFHRLAQFFTYVLHQQFIYTGRAIKSFTKYSPKEGVCKSLDLVDNVAELESTITSFSQICTSADKVSKSGVSLQFRLSFFVVLDEFETSFSVG